MSDQRTAEPTPAPTTAETRAASRQKGRAIAGALAGVAVIALLIGVFVIVQTGGDDKTPAAAPPAASAPAQAETPPAEPPAGEPSAPAQEAPPVDPALREKPVVEAGEGDVTELTVTPLVRGKGPEVQAGQQILVNYVGVTYADGEEFDSSWRRNQPFPTAIGVGQVIPGWDEGLVGVAVGSRVQLDIPADMAYGETPSGGAPAGDLRFVVDILQAQ